MRRAVNSLRTARILALLAAASMPAASGLANPGEAFPFLIPGFDASPTATDVSSLGRKPAGADGPVQVVGGHLVDGRGERLRLLGVNFSFGANFPEHDDAEKVAAHLAKMGVNAVRHHHMDARDIWRRKTDGSREVDPAKVEKLAYLITQLKKHGIFSNINLHVSRSVTKAEGFPDADKLPRYNKYVLYIDERLQGRLKDYARALLTYENPHTGLRLADEPSIVTVEITNENRFAVSGHRQLSTLPERYQAEFRRRWNTWLRREYSATSRLREAWGAGSEPLGNDIADFGDFARRAEPWSLSVRGGNRARLLTAQPGPKRGNNAVRVSIERADGVIHQLELVRGGLTVEEGRVYTASFWLRSAKPRAVYFDASRDGKPWGAIGIRETVRATERWQHVVRAFRATTTLRAQARWIFKLGDSDADLWLADPHLRRGGEMMPLDPGCSLEKGTIPVPPSAPGKAVARDLRAFMEDTERAFFAEMCRFLKKEIGVKAPVTGSQVGWQALSAFEPLDLVDAHAYWQHPRFPRRSWDSRDWNIPNTPMVRNPGNDALTRLAWYRVWGRPYTVSEYNHPAPSDYQVECVPLLCALAGLQDWDGVYVYSYQHGSGNWDSDRIQRFFDINGNPAKLALLPTGAMLFRRADVTPARERISAGREAGQTRGQALEHRAGTDLASESAVRALPRPEVGEFRSDTGQIRWQARDPDRARFLVDTPRTKLALGFIGDDEIQLDGLRLKTGPASRNFGVLSLTALDGEPLVRSRRMLLTTLSRAENRGAVWNEDRTSVADRWGTSPPMVEIVPAEVSLRRDDGDALRAWRAFPLDPVGRRRDPVGIVSSERELTFRADPEDRTLWYEIVRE